MKNIELKVRVPLAAALARGVSQYGETTITLSDSCVAELSPEARAIVADRVGGSPIPLEEPTVEALIAELEKLATEAREKAEKNKVEVEERIARALAADDIEWVRYADCDPVRGYEPRLECPSSGLDDPRITERYEQLRRDVLPAYLERYRAAYAERAARDAAKKLEHQRAVERYEAAIRECALGYDDLARPATEGYPVETAVLNRLTKQFEERLVERRLSVAAPDLYVTHANETWGSPEDRSSPTPEVFTMLDVVASIARDLNEKLPEAIGRWQVSRIVRVDVCSHGGKTHFVTAVLATLDPGKVSRQVRQITVSLEEQECSHDEDC